MFLNKPFTLTGNTNGADGIEGAGSAVPSSSSSPGVSGPAAAAPSPAFHDLPVIPTARTRCRRVGWGGGRGALPHSPPSTKPSKAGGCPVPGHGAAAAPLLGTPSPVLQREQPSAGGTTGPLRLARQMGQIGAINYFHSQSSRERVPRTPALQV